MINQFDSANYPNSEPDELPVGSFWAWTRSDISAIYPASEYTLSYLILSLSGDNRKIEITAGSDGDDHVVTVDNEITFDYRAGDYKYIARIVRTSDQRKVTVDEGFIKLVASDGDIRSHSRKVLDAIRATIEKTATKEQISYSIAGRSLSRRSVEELLELEKTYARRVVKEEQALLRSQGKAKKNSVLVKMGA